MSDETVLLSAQNLCWLKISFSFSHFSRFEESTLKGFKQLSIARGVRVRPTCCNKIRETF